MKSFFMKYPCDEIKAEAMSTAVAKVYRDVAFFRQTRINIAQSLYLTVAKVLNERGVKKVKGFTRKSNVFVNASLSFLGWKKIQSYSTSCLWVWDTESAIQRFGVSL